MFPERHLIKCLCGHKFRTIYQTTTDVPAKCPECKILLDIEFIDKKITIKKFEGDEFGCLGSKI